MMQIFRKTGAKAGMLKCPRVFSIAPHKAVRQMKTQYGIMTAISKAVKRHFGEKSKNGTAARAMAATTIVMEVSMTASQESVMEAHL